MDTIPAIVDTSPVQLPLPAEERGESTQMSIRDQLESARIAQQMFHQSEIQKFEGVIQALVSEMREMQQEDEGSEKSGFNNWNDSVTQLVWPCST